MPTTFFDANGAYYETLTDREAPDGHAVAPAKPGPFFEWDATAEAWVENLPAGTVDRVKAEAARRILALCPEWKQRNLIAQAVILQDKGRANWTPEEQAAWDAGAALWAQIAAIRAKSDQIEAMDPIPHDVENNAIWES